MTWCNSAVNRASLSFCAAWRTRSSPFDTSGPALCPGRVVLSVFPLAERLPSPASATADAALFGRLVGTMRPSDFPCPFTSGVPPKRSLSGLARDQRVGRAWDLPVLAHGGSVHALVL